VVKQRVRFKGGVSIVCPHCGQRVKPEVEDAALAIVTDSGVIDVVARVYRCPNCGQEINFRSNANARSRIRAWPTGGSSNEGFNVSSSSTGRVKRKSYDRALKSTQAYSRVCRIEEFFRKFNEYAREVISIAESISRRMVKKKWFTIKPGKVVFNEDVDDETRIIKWFDRTAVIIIDPSLFGLVSIVKYGKVGVEVPKIIQYVLYVSAQESPIRPYQFKRIVAKMSKHRIGYRREATDYWYVLIAKDLTRFLKEDFEQKPHKRKIVPPRMSWFRSEEEFLEFVVNYFIKRLKGQLNKVKGTRVYGKVAAAILFLYKFVKYSEERLKKELLPRDLDIDVLTIAKLVDAALKGPIAATTL